MKATDGVTPGGDTMNLHLHALLIAGLALGLTPVVDAHAHATVIELDDTRCYIVTDGFGTLSAVATGRPGGAQPEYWIETNGYLGAPGEFHGAPSGTGLPVYGLPYWDFGEIVVYAIPPSILGHPRDIHPAFADGQSGLQRGPVTLEDGTVIPPDTRVSPDEWLARCA